MSGERVAGVRFERYGRVYFVSAPDVELAVGNQVQVEVEGQVRFGRVVVAPEQVLVCELEELRGRVIRP